MDILSNSDYQYNRLIKPVIYSASEDTQLFSNVHKEGNVFFSLTEGDLWTEASINHYTSQKRGIQHRIFEINNTQPGTKLYLLSTTEYLYWKNIYIGAIPDTDSVKYTRPANVGSPPVGSTVNNFKIWMRTNIMVHFCITNPLDTQDGSECVLYADFYDKNDVLMKTELLDMYQKSMVAFGATPVNFPINVILQGDIIYSLQPQEYARFYIMHDTPFEEAPQLTGYMEHHELSEMNGLTIVK